MAQKHPLVIAREMCNLTQEQFATKVGLSVKTIWKAEHNQRIGAYSRGKICKYLKLTAEELGLVLQSEQEMEYIAASDKRAEIDSLVEDRDRDQKEQHTLQIRAGLLSTAFVSPQMGILQPDTLPLSEFLPLSVDSIQSCWHLMQGEHSAVAERVLDHQAPILTRIALRPSPYQKEAALLATQVAILRAILAKHRLNYVARELHCYEAVQFSKLSHDRVLQSAALVCLGHTYLFCPPLRVKKAIETFLEALHVLGKCSSIIRSDIFIALAEIYSLQGDKQQTYTAIGQAKDAYPDHPRSDSSYFYADYPVNLLHQAEAKALLHLHQPRRALEALQASNKEPLTDRGRCEHLIRQAEAGRQCNNLELFRSSLTEGSLLATELGSSHRLQSALKVYNQAPRDWKENAQVKWLNTNILSRKDWHILS